MKNKSIVTLSNVSVYKNKQNILKNISIKIFENRVLAIIGPNGGGKTTLIETILGITKASSGKIEVGAEKFNIGYMPQFVLKSCCMPMSCLDFVYSGFYNCKNFGFFKNSNMLNIAKNIIERIGLKKIESLSIYKTSGGQLQLLSLARTVVNNPKIVFLDEPTSNTDVNAKKIISEIIREIKKNTTVVVSSHDGEWVKSISDDFFCVQCFGNRLEKDKLNEHINNRWH